MLGRLQRWPCLRLLPTRARASALYVMGGRQWLLSDALFFLHVHGLRAPRYGRAVYIKYKHKLHINTDVYKAPTALSHHAHLQMTAERHTLFLHR